MYPIAFIISMVAMLIFIEVTNIYLSEIGYLTEIREYYKKETDNLFINFHPDEDALIQELHYNE